MDLFPHVPTVVFQIVNFLILALLLYFILFKPVTRSMKKRAVERERMKRELSEDRAEAAKLREELDARLADAEAEADAIVASAQERADETAEDMLQRARDEAQRILADAYAESQQLRSEATAAAQRSIVDTALEVAQEMIAQVVPPESHERLVQQLADRIWDMGRSEMDRVEGFRRSLGERIPTAHVVSARPLSQEQQGLLARTLTALADRNVDLEIQEDGRLAAGLRVRLADIYVDSSVAGQLEALREDALESLRSEG